MQESHYFFGGDPTVELLGLSWWD